MADFEKSPRLGDLRACAETGNIPGPSPNDQAPICVSHLCLSGGDNLRCHTKRAGVPVVKAPLLLRGHAICERFSYALRISPQYSRQKGNLGEVRR